MAGKDVHDLGSLNALLFEELERLTSIDATDRDAVSVEVSRAKAIQGIASEITSSSRVVLDTVRLRAEWAGSKYAATPRMLNG